MAWLNVWQDFVKFLKVYGVVPESNTAPPSIPTNLRVDQNEAGFIRILWDEGSGEVTAFSYQIYRNGNPQAIVTNQIFLDSGLPPNQSYTYQVQAISEFGIASGLSEQLVVSTTVNTPPVWQDGNTLFILTEGQAFSLDFNSICDDADGQTITYTRSTGVLPSGLSEAGSTVSGTPGFSSQGDYNLAYIADDGHGGTALLSTTFRVVNVDVTAPSIPQSVVASNLTSTTASLSWQPSTDTETGVQSYKIYQKIGSGSSVLRATSADATFADTGLTPATAYSYKVSAVDGNNNESGLSASVPVNTPAAADTAPPTVPTGFTTTTVTTNSVGLLWSPSSDTGTGVGGYNVYVATVGHLGPYTKLSSTPTNSLNVTSLGSGTDYWFKVTAFDKASPPNESAQTDFVSIQTNSVNPNFIKFHTGHYLLSADKMTGNTTATAGYQPSYILNKPTEVIGWEQLVYWSALENTVKGQYDFSPIDTLLEFCAENNMRLIIQIVDRSFNSSGGTNMIPAYLATEPGAGGGWYAKPGGGYVPKYWLKPVMDRFIALCTAMSARYDGHPNFEALTLIETDLNFSVGPSDYSVSNYMTQLYSLINAQAAIWPHTSVLQQANFLATEVGMEDYIINHLIPARIELSGPDIKGTTNNTTFSSLSWGQRIVAGYRYRNGAWTGGFQQYFGQVGMACELQDPDMGGKAAHGTCAQNYDLALNYMKLHRMIWERKNFALPAQYTAAQLMYDNSNYSGTAAGGVVTPDIKTYLGAPLGTHPLVSTKPAYYPAVNIG